MTKQKINFLECCSFLAGKNKAKDITLGMYCTKVLVYVQLESTDSSPSTNMEQ